MLRTECQWQALNVSELRAEVSIAAYIDGQSEESRMAHRRKVMVIGLDGLTLKMLRPLVAEGRLPTFARLMADGTSGILHSVGNMTTGPTWASFATGCLPQNHGIPHDFFHLSEGYRLRPTSGADCRRPPFWQLASDAGQRVVVLNVPMSYPVQPLNGAILAGIDAPSERAPGFAYPPDLLRTLRRQGIDYLIDCGLASYMQRGHLLAGRKAVQRETEGHTRAAEFLLAQADWDLFVTVYSLPDVWQHYGWGALPGSAGHGLVREGYTQMDEHLSRLLAHLPADGVVMLCSDHGFGPLTGTRDHLNRALAQWGFLRYAAGTSKRSLSRALLATTRRLVSFRRRQQVLAALPRVRRLVETRLRIGGIDWPHTQVYAALDHQELWVNVQGRQPAGCVAQAEVDAVCEQITAVLLEWRNEASGAPYVMRVERNPDAGRAAPDHLAPDLLLTWNPDAAPGGLHPLIIGDHTPDGAIIVAGGSVQSGGQVNASLCDVAPIALHALGLAQHAAMDGRVPPQLFYGA